MPPVINTKQTTSSGGTPLPVSCASGNVSSCMATANQNLLVSACKEVNATAPTASTCKPLSKIQLSAFQDAIVQQEVGTGGCTLANGGCQDNIGDPAAPEQFASGQLTTPSGYTPVSLGASGGATQDLYYNQVQFLLQNETNAAVRKDCGSSLPAQDQPMPSQTTLQAAVSRASAVTKLFHNINKLLSIPKPTKTSPAAQKSAYADLQTIIQDAQGSKKTPPVDQATMDQLLLSFIKQYGFTTTPKTGLPSLPWQDLTDTELQSGLNSQELLNMAYFWLARNHDENIFLPYFHPNPMSPQNLYYRGFSLFMTGDGNEAKFDFVTQGMLHSATLTPGPNGQSTLTWTTHTGLATYLIQRDETTGNPPAMSACYVDMMQQNLVDNPKTYASQGCVKGQEASCTLPGTKVVVPLWVLRASRAQNAGPGNAVSQACSAYDESYPESVGRYYNDFYKQLSASTHGSTPPSAG